ncbi:hypothetical protein CALCODRAFT_501369 [Calocera cornea HHB12733]|uniref:Uncharacterized protein n=1 Tax=Calocera cornea HHB12733 TaxID=1353952 RepID=A0A165DP33_9BASI|nr:hypothetical protein CALCODRAFT_501369 [Calocera cornea HHB12733]
MRFHVTEEQAAAAYRWSALGPDADLAASHVPGSIAADDGSPGAAVHNGLCFQLFAYRLDDFIKAQADGVPINNLQIFWPSVGMAVYLARFEENQWKPQASIFQPEECGDNSEEIDISAFVEPGLMRMHVSADWPVSDYVFVLMATPIALDVVNLG